MGHGETQAQNNGKYGKFTHPYHMNKKHMEFDQNGEHPPETIQDTVHTR